MLLLKNPATKTIINKDGYLYLITQWLSPDEANHYFHLLQKQISWQQENIRLFGKDILCPRLTAWHGDPGIFYTYSGVAHMSPGWNDVLLLLKNKIMDETNCAFNGVLCNYYRDGQDSMGWHADDEKALGENPIIVSVSLGETRTFKLKHRCRSDKISIELNSGSLLIMAGALQQYWLHALPKTKLNCSARINLTFRNIIY